MLGFLAILSLVGVAPDPVAGTGELRWTAPAACPDQAQMARRIGDAGGRGGLVVEATVSQESAESWRVDLILDLDGQRDVRTLYGTDCSSVADAIELLVAVRLDVVPEEANESPRKPSTEPKPALVVEPDLPVPSEVATTPATPRDSNEVDSPASAAPPKRVQRVRPRPPTGLMLGAAVGIGAGASPLPSVPLELAIGWSFPRLRIAARGRYHVPRLVEIDDSRAALLQLGMAGIEVCARPSLVRLEFPLCGQLSAGGSRSDARGTAANDRAGVWAETGLDVGVAWSLTRVWAVTARIGGAAVVAGTGYVLGDIEVFRPTPVVGRLMLGVEAHIGSRSSGGRRRGG